MSCAAVQLPTDHPAHAAAVNGGAIPESLERVTSRRNQSPIRLSDAQADAFLRARERDEAHQAETVGGGVAGEVYTGIVSI